MENQKNKTIERKVYSSDEIKRMAPRYKGKPENFNPEKVGNSKSVKKPAVATPQRNESIISDAIFGIDISVTELRLNQYFSANYGKIIDISNDIYDAYCIHVKQIDREILREEMAYYSTTLLHMKLIEVKFKQGIKALTGPEEEIKEAVHDTEFNVPQPLYIYLNEIGTYYDKMGKKTLHDVPSLPVAVAQGFGGYHYQQVDTDTHNLFEEVPSLGIAGDMLMALASAEDNPVPNVRVGRPQDTEFTDNLIGYHTQIGPRRPEIKQKLLGFGISATRFDEYIPNTRFHLKYVQAISDTISQYETFEREKVTFKNFSLAGGETQVIKTTPLDHDEIQRWNQRSVQSTSTTNSVGYIGASICFGFQLFKEDGPGEDRRGRTQNWSCVTGDTWVMPDDWYNNRNQRRDLPEGVGTARFRAISLRQDHQLLNTVRRMIAQNM